MQAMIAESFQMSELCREGIDGNKGGDTPKFGLLEGSSKGDMGKPPRVLPVEWLRRDVEALKKLTSGGPVQGKTTST